MPAKHARGKRGAPATAGPVGDAFSGRAAGPNTVTNIAILAALILLAVYTGFAAMRLRQSPPLTAEAASAGLPSHAEALAARLDSEIGAVRAGLAAAQEFDHRVPTAPLDAAEAGLKVAGPSADALAVMSGDQPAAAAGPARGLDWKAAAHAATDAQGDLWVGAAPATAGPPALVAVLGAADGRPAVIGALNHDRLAEVLENAPMAAVVLPDGRLAAAAGPGGVEGAQTLLQAFNVAPDALKAGRVVRVRRADGAAADLMMQPVAGGALMVVDAVPAAGAAADAIERDRMENLVSLFAPLAIACILALLLIVQGRRADAARRAFAASQERFRLAVEAARCGIWEWDLRSDTFFMSDVTGVMLGWGGGGMVSGEEILGRVAPEHRERLRLSLAEAAIHGALDVSFRATRPDGQTVWIDARGQAVGEPDADGYSKLIGVALDVTDERMAQVRAQAAENRLRDAIESISEAFVLWDRHGRLMLCNQNFRSFFNLEPKVLKPGAGRAWVERFMRLAVVGEMPGDDMADGPREIELSGGRWIQIAERRTADRGRVVTYADITAIKHQDEARRLNEEQLQRAVVSLERSREEASELAQKYAAEKVRAEAANKSKSEFLANMSHELRTPLNAINGFSEIMVGEMFGALGDARYVSYAQDILSSGQHLLALINDILDMSKIEAGKMNLRFEYLSLDELAEDAVRLVRNRAESAGLKLTVDFPSLPEIEGDQRALKQVLLNLLSNAVKFTPRGGSVTLRAESRRDALGERVRISVIDTGIGIAKDDLSRLARPFEQVESQHAKTQQGTGLGLALTKSLVEMHGGVLELESTPGEGTTASFILPVRQSRAAIGDRSFAAA